MAKLCQIGDHMKWYVFHVKTGKEDVVSSYFQSILADYNEIDFKIFIPKRELIEYREGLKTLIYKPLFPGYILICTDSILSIYSRIKFKRWHSDLLTILKIGSVFQEVKLEEILPVINMVNKEGIIDKSIIFLEQDKVIITGGPLVNYEGIIKKINKRKGRAKISFIILNRKVEMDISIQCIEKINKKDIKNTIFFT